jgi:hypothetical protein
MRHQTGLIVSCAAALLLATTTATPQASGNKGKIDPPPVPANLEVPPGHKAFLEGHAYGTQNYSCLPTATGVAWTFQAPQATLFNDNDNQTMTHFLSPNPVESGTLRATWQHSRDTSAVWAAAIASSTDPNYVAPGAVPWLLLRVVGAAEGPDGGDKLTETVLIHRVNTAGGIAPAAGCATGADIGKRVFVPYETDYIFYREKD